MPAAPAVFDELDPRTSRFYVNALAVLAEAKVPYLLGGAYALAHYTGIARHTKDLDLFVRPADAPRALNVLAHAGYRTEMTFPHWLGKAFSGDDFVDVIFCSGNGLCAVDDDWFAHACRHGRAGRRHALPGRRVDLAKMLHHGAPALRRRRPESSAPRVRSRPELGPSAAPFRAHWQLLLGHLILFGFVYPAEQGKVPVRVLDTLLECWRKETRCADTEEKVCRGTLLSRMQYLTDTERWGYKDPRLSPPGAMTAEQITHWTAAGR